MSQTEYPIGTRRVRREFVFTMSIGGESRQLQFCMWEEEYVFVCIPSLEAECYWRPLRWLSTSDALRLAARTYLLHPVNWFA